MLYSNRVILDAQLLFSLGFHSLEWLDGLSEAVRALKTIQGR